MTTIDVTAADIEAGERGECQVCPVALAIKRVIRGDLIVSVIMGDVAIYKPTDLERSLVRIELPDKVGTFITDFDKDRSVTPFAFAIKIPPQFLREAVPA